MRQRVEKLSRELKEAAQRHENGTPGTADEGREVSTPQSVGR
jgi:hypothetical protein